jgi:aspartyl-tRNA(Asn)/glutamyl-tRNA(Gln) amidotransferase subunit B
MVEQGNTYEAVIGLEVHAQLQTASKLFCGDPTEFGALPNTEVSPVSLGHPGTLPVLNGKAVELAVRLGLACRCEIERQNYFARKNYFYPDLPKGYQISQHTTPICKQGFVRISTVAGERNVRLNRIHMEEDAGKSIHDASSQVTCLDYNRAGMPLVEIVTEPDLHSGDEAFAFLTEIRKLVRWMDVCDGNMEEGSLRCDANISIRRTGESRLGTKVEVKNLNSIRNVRKAIEVEIERLKGLLETGLEIRQETRSFNADNDTTFSIRTKEDADDYRYFPEPDIPPFILTDEWISKIKAELPALPEELFAKFTSISGLAAYDAAQLTEDRTLALYFEQITEAIGDHKVMANWLLGPVRAWLNEREADWEMVKLEAGTWKALNALMQAGKINFSVAAHRVLPLLLSGEKTDPVQLATELNLIQDAGADDIQRWVTEVLEQMPDKVSEYRRGKKGLLGLFVGEVKRISKGKADPKRTNDLLLEKLNQS